MKVNLIVKDDGTIASVITYPLLSSRITVDIDSLDDISVGYDKYVNGEIVKSSEVEEIKTKAVVYTEILSLKKKLAESDYKCLKYIDGDLTEEEYAEVKALRASYRSQINELEKSL